MCVGAGVARGGGVVMELSPMGIVASYIDYVTRNSNSNYMHGFYIALWMVLGVHELFYLANGQIQMMLDIFQEMLLHLVVQQEHLRTTNPVILAFYLCGRGWLCLDL